MFVFVLSFHDASHGRLHPVHRMNEAFGHVLGTVMFIPLNVYRFAHARHHANSAAPATRSYGHSIHRMFPDRCDCSRRSSKSSRICLYAALVPAFGLCRQANAS